MNLTTKLPHDEMEYEINGGYSRFNTWEVGAIINAPISDNLFVRGNVYYEESDGFLINLSPTGNDDSYDHISFRVAARWEATEAFTADVSFMRTVENDGTDTNVNTGIMDFDTPNSTPWLLPVEPGADTFLPFNQLFPVDAGSGFYPDERRVINKDFDEFNKNRQNIFNARLNYQGEGWSLRSITGVMKTTSHRPVRPGTWSSIRCTRLTADAPAIPSARRCVLTLSLIPGTGPSALSTPMMMRIPTVSVQSAAITSTSESQLLLRPTARLLLLPVSSA